MDALSLTSTLSSPINDATLRCVRGFDAILESSCGKDASKAEDNLSRFRIWAGNIGAFHSLPRRVSADFRLRDAPEVRSRILELLDDILETNNELHALLNDNEDDAEYEADFDPVEDLCLSVSDSITSLLKVSTLLRKATTRDRYAQALASKHDALPVEYSAFDRRHVAEKFPKLKEQQWLCDRLADAITTRRRFLRYAQRHQHRIAEVPAEIKGPIDVAIPIAPSQAQKSSLAPKTTTTKVVSTAASTLQILKLAELKLDQLDMGDDDNMSQATSFVSDAGLDDDNKSHVIELDKITKRGEPFECPYCRGMVHFTNQRAWRKHVFHDLRAYVCTFPDCDAGLFEDRNSWFAHELERHRRLLVCLVCSNKLFHDVKSFQAHLESAHPDQHQLVSDSIIKASSRPVAEIPAVACPMCNDWATKLQTGLSASETVTVSPNLFKQHLSGHQEQLALFAITPNLDRELDSEDGSQKSGISQRKRQDVLLKWHNEIEAGSEDGSDPLDKDEPLVSDSSAAEPLSSHSDPFTSAAKRFESNIPLSLSDEQSREKSSDTPSIAQDSNQNWPISGAEDLTSSGRSRLRMIYDRLGPEVTGNETLPHELFPNLQSHITNILLPNMHNNPTLSRSLSAFARRLQAFEVDTTTNYWGMRTTVVTNKFGTWGVEVKGQIEALDEDFDFGDPPKAIPPAVREDNKRIDRRPLTLVRTFYFTAVSETRGHMTAASEEWTTFIDRHLGLFAGILLSVIDKYGWSMACPASIVKLRALETDLLRSSVQKSDPPVDVHKSPTMDEGIQAPDQNRTVPPTKLPDAMRVSAYELRNNDFHDLGAGLCSVEYLNRMVPAEALEARIVVKNELSVDETILATRVTKSDDYQKQQDTLIVWTEPRGTEKMLSFKNAEDCTQMCTFLKNLQAYLWEERKFHELRRSLRSEQEQSTPTDGADTTVKVDIEDTGEIDPTDTPSSALRPPPAYRCSAYSCMETFKSDIELSRHTLEVHNPNNAQLVACKYPGCHQNFFAKEAMVEHMHQDHRSSLPERPLTEGISDDRTHDAIASRAPSISGQLDGHDYDTAIETSAITAHAETATATSNRMIEGDPSNARSIPAEDVDETKLSSAGVVSINEGDRHTTIWPCEYEPCASENKVFNQRSDLGRHFDEVHARATTQIIDCEYPGCHRRAENGFLRRDELLEHLQDIHKVHVQPTSGVSSSEAPISVTPAVLWAQRSSATDAAQNLVRLTIIAPGVPRQGIKLDLSSTAIAFLGFSESKKVMYAKELQLFAEIDPEKSKIIHGEARVEMTLQKKKLSRVPWPRLLKDRAKAHSVKTGFEDWIGDDQQDNEVENDSKAMEDEDSSGTTELKSKNDEDSLLTFNTQVAHQDKSDIHLTTFEYVRDRVTMEFTIRCDVAAVNIDALSEDFKRANSIYPEVFPSFEDRAHLSNHEHRRNVLGWALADLNPSIREKPGLIQRAVEHYHSRIPSRRQSRLELSENLCMFCKQEEAHDRSDIDEHFLVCFSCGNHAHQKCARQDTSLAVAQGKTQWQCKYCLAKKPLPSDEGLMLSNIQIQELHDIAETVRHKHKFKILKPDPTMHLWDCNICLSGPHSYIYECNVCLIQVCKSCTTGTQSTNRGDPGCQPRGIDRSDTLEEAAGRQTAHPSRSRIIWKDVALGKYIVQDKLLRLIYSKCKADNILNLVEADFRIRYETDDCILRIPIEWEFTQVSASMDEVATSDIYNVRQKEIQSLQPLSAIRDDQLEAVDDIPHLDSGSGKMKSVLDKRTVH